MKHVRLGRSRRYVKPMGCEQEQPGRDEYDYLDGKNRHNLGYKRIIEHQLHHLADRFRGIDPYQDRRSAANAIVRQFHH